LLGRQSLLLFFILGGYLMKIIHPVCCGVDVHKNTIVATIAITKNIYGSSYITESFNTLNPDLIRFRTWLLDHNCFEVCMESTGKYWIPIFNILEEAKIHVLLTHPKYVRAIKGQKTDKKDSKWIAGLFKCDFIRGSFIPPKDFRAMREIGRYRFKAVAMRTSERNRYQNCMTVSNIGLASVLTDPFGKSAKNIMNYALQSEVFDNEQVKKLILGRAKNKESLICESMQGFRIESDQRFKMNEANAHMHYLDNLIIRTETELFIRVQPYWDIVERLSQQIPGVSTLSSALIISEIGVDMPMFESAKHFTAWAGLVPTNNESAGKKKSVRISKAGQFLKPLLVTCAHAAVRCNKQPYFANKFNAIKKRRGQKKAIIAIARMMLVCIYHMILKGEDFIPSDYAELNSPKPYKVILTDNVAIAYLASKGYDVSCLTKPVSEELSMAKGSEDKSADVELLIEKPSLKSVERPSVKKQASEKKQSVIMAGTG
jgi:transposase